MKIGDTSVLLVGGVGGSGTRVVAEVVRHLGFNIGCNLNASLDNLDWPGHRELLLDLSKPEESKRSEMAPAFLTFAEQHMAAAISSDERYERGVATKVPGSFYYLPYVRHYFGDVRYIHVIRHGADMAFSRNQNQLRNWGRFFGLATSDEILPGDLLQYWVLANRYALKQCEAHLPESHLVVRFEDLCANRDAAIDRIAEFVGVEKTLDSVKTPQRVVVPPASIGRYRASGRAGMFAPGDIEALRTFGYDVEWQSTSTSGCCRKDRVPVMPTQKPKQ